MDVGALGPLPGVHKGATGEVRLEPPRAALLRGARLHRLGDGAPVGAVRVVQLGQLPVLRRAPLAALHRGVQVSPPPPHALLIRSPLHVLRNRRPLFPVRLDQRAKLFVIMIGGWIGLGGKGRGGGRRGGWGLVLDEGCLSILWI